MRLKKSRNAGWWISFTDRRGRRHSIRLGWIQTAEAEEILAYVERLHAARAERRKLDDDILHWLDRLEQSDDPLQYKLEKAGLIMTQFGFDAALERYLESKVSW